MQIVDCKAIRERVLDGEDYMEKYLLAEIDAFDGVQKSL